MLAQFRHRLNGRSVRLGATAVVVSAAVVLSVSAPAGARTNAPQGMLVPAGAVSPSGVSRVDTVDKRKKSKKKIRKRATGAIVPKRQVDAVAPAGSLLASLPSAVDLSNHSVPVGDQGDVGSCVAWTINYAMLGWYSRKDGRPGQPFHPMYSYSQLHSKPGTKDGGGSDPTRAMQLVLNRGAATVANYSIKSLTDFRTQPSAADHVDAAKHRISAFETLFANVNRTGSAAGATMIKTALAAGKPVAITLNVRPGFNIYNKTSATATVTDVTGTVTGAHEVLATGYDPGGLWFQNSWGTRYGFKGYARLSWRVVEKDVYQAHTMSGFATSSNTNNNVTPRDTTPPAMGAVNQQFQLEQQITSTTAPVTFSWSASDPSGIAAFAVYVKTGNGEYVHQASVPATATRYTFALSFGVAYKLAVAAKDGAGNWSAYSYSAAVTPGVFDDTSFTVGSPWARYNLPDAFGGSYIAAGQAGAWVEKSFAGTDIALVAPKFASAGRATVYCDGQAVGTGDFYSASTVNRQVMAHCHFAQSGRHTIKVVAEGTAGRPWLGVDAFAVLG